MKASFRRADTVMASMLAAFTVLALSSCAGPLEGGDIAGEYSAELSNGVRVGTSVPFVLSQSYPLGSRSLDSSIMVLAENGSAATSHYYTYRNSPWSKYEVHFTGTWRLDGNTVWTERSGYQTRYDGGSPANYTYSSRPAYRWLLSPGTLTYAYPVTTSAGSDSTSSSVYRRR